MYTVPTWTRPLILTGVEMFVGYQLFDILNPHPWGLTVFLGMITLPHFASLEAQRQTLPAGNNDDTEEDTVFSRDLINKLTYASDDTLSKELQSIAKQEGLYRYDVRRGGNLHFIYFPHGVTRKKLGEFHALVFETPPLNKATQSKLCGANKPFQNNNKELQPGIVPPLPAFLDWLRVQENRLGAEWFKTDNEFNEGAGRVFHAFAQE